MTLAASIHHLSAIERLDSKGFAFSGEPYQILRRADDRIEPVQLTEALGAEDKPDVVSVGVDFPAHFGDLVFHKPVGVRRFRRQLQNCHSNALPALGAKLARGKTCTNDQWLQSDKHDSPYSYRYQKPSFVNARTQIARFARPGCANAHDREWSSQ